MPADRDAALSGGRVTIEVKVNTDMVPGWGFDPQDFVDLIQRSLDSRIPHYEPTVTLKESSDV